MRAGWALLVAVFFRVLRRVYRILSWIDYWLSFFRKPSQIVSVWPEAGMVFGPRIAIFVHFDGQGLVRDHTLHYVAALRDAGLSVLFVTNSGKLLPVAMDKLRPLCAGVLVRRNIGYDFGAMREGLEYLKLPRPDTEMVVIANDSIYGPLGPLSDIIARVDFTKADFWGATDSWQQRYHIQSYFVAAGPKVLASKAWRDFWKQVRPVKAKTWVVFRYELGLSQAVVRGGHSVDAIWRYEDLVHNVNQAWLMEPQANVPTTAEPMIKMRFIHAHRIRHNVATRTPLNPTSDLWRQLIQAGFPFIKRELLRDNPTHIADLNDWRDEVRKRFGEVPEAIEHDLRRVMRNRVS